MITLWRDAEQSESLILAARLNLRHIPYANQRPPDQLGREGKAKALNIALGWIDRVREGAALGRGGPFLFLSLPHSVPCSDVSLLASP